MGSEGGLRGAAEQKHENVSLECTSFLLIISSVRLFLRKHEGLERWAFPLWGPFPVHAHGLFKDTVNQATRSSEGARQGEL